jgi:cytochrome c-550 PedF
MIKTMRCAALFGALASVAFAHGDVAPQPVNTDALPEVGEEWLTENPYREMGDEVWAKAVEIGASAYNSNCARCHGLEVVSGGLAPDLRYLSADWDGDEWFIERYQNGYTQNGVTKMPAFGELLGQKAAWAIRTYVETRPEDGALEDHTDRLREIRDMAETLEPSDEQAARDLADELTAINAMVPTASGAPLADSPALQAAHLLARAEPNRAAEVLTVGLSNAQ